MLCLKHTQSEVIKICMASTTLAVGLNSNWKQGYCIQSLTPQTVNTDRCWTCYFPPKTSGMPVEIISNLLRSLQKPRCCDCLLSGCPNTALPLVWNTAVFAEIRGGNRWHFSTICTPWYDFLTKMNRRQIFQSLFWNQLLSGFRMQTLSPCLKVILNPRSLMKFIVRDGWANSKLRNS